MNINNKITVSDLMSMNATNSFYNKYTPKQQLTLNNNNVDFIADQNLKQCSSCNGDIITKQNSIFQNYQNQQLSNNKILIFGHLLGFRNLDIRFPDFMNLKNTTFDFGTCQMPREELKRFRIQFSIQHPNFGGDPIIDYHYDYFVHTLGDIQIDKNGQFHYLWEGFGGYLDTSLVIEVFGVCDICCTPDPIAKHIGPNQYEICHKRPYFRFETGYQNWDKTFDDISLPLNDNSFKKYCIMCEGPCEIVTVPIVSSSS